MFKLFNYAESFADILNSPGDNNTLSCPACPDCPKCSECPKCLDCPKCTIADTTTNNKNNYIKNIIGLLVLIASVSMAIYRLNKYKEIKGTMETPLYSIGVLLIAFCCNACYLPYALIYTFVFKKFD